MPRLNGREMVPPLDDRNGVDTVARSDGRRAQLRERVTSSGAFWAQVLKLCRHTPSPRGLLASGVLCLLLKDDIDLSIDEIAQATGFNKGHCSRKIHQTRGVMRRLLRSNAESTLLDQVAELLSGACPPSDFAGLNDRQWRRLDRTIKQNPSNQRPFDRRQAANAVAWKIQTGKRWRDLPPRFGSPSAAMRRCRRWKTDGTFDQLQSIVLEV